MLSKIFQFVKEKFNAILLALIVILFILFSFAAGYIMTNYQHREPIQIIQ